jgi:carboxylesterase type B
VQTYIGQVNGDKDQVSAFGESAGASSILHHLIREGGTIDPTFDRFAVQSPAFEWAWDNSPNGKLDKIYKNFSDLAGCGQNFDINCLRSSTNLSDANQALFNSVRQTGLFPVGPAVDDVWIKTIPTLSFANSMWSFPSLTPWIQQANRFNRSVLERNKLHYYFPYLERICIFHAKGNHI